MKLRLLLLTLVLVGSALVVGWLFDEQSVLSPTRDDFKIPDNIDYYLSRVDYRAMNEQGKLNYRLQTPYLEHYIREDTSQIEQPRFHFLGEPSQWKIRSGKASLQHRAERFELTQKVELQRESTIDPLRLNTSLMILLARDKIVDIPQPLTLKTPTLQLQAKSAQIHMSQDLYQFSGVRATYQPVARDTLHEDS